MAKYEVLANEVSILKSHSTHRNADGKIIGYDHESVTYLKGAVIDEEDISPVVLRQYKDGDERLKSLIKVISQKPKQKQEDAPKEQAPKKKVADDETKSEKKEESPKEPNKSALPFPGYDELEVPQILEKLSKSNQQQINKVLVYEQENKARQTILDFKKAE